MTVRPRPVLAASARSRIAPASRSTCAGQNPLDLVPRDRVYAAPMARDGLLIGEVAAKSGVSRKALRLYEKAGIFPPARRTGSGYRVYGPETLALLGFVAQARRLGFRLDEIKRIVALKRSGRTPYGGRHPRGCGRGHERLPQRAASRQLGRALSGAPREWGHTQVWQDPDGQPMAAHGADRGGGRCEPGQAQRPASPLPPGAAAARAEESRRGGGARPVTTVTIASASPGEPSRRLNARVTA